MEKRALIVQGGWSGHEPAQVAETLKSLLEQCDVTVDVHDNLETFDDIEALRQYNVVIPNWTMGTITQNQLSNLTQVISDGVGLAGLHGGLGDAFRSEPEFQYMVGGQWVSHPGGDGVTYNVHIEDEAHEITDGIEDFTVTSEQYYMHVDPAIHVLATTNFGTVRMPVAWTKMYGRGKVFYCSLGHTDEVVKMPPVSKFMQQGICFALSD